jgi:signal peptide peptidase SppA
MSKKMIDTSLLSQSQGWAGTDTAFFDLERQLRALTDDAAMQAVLMDRTLQLSTGGDEDPYEDNSATYHLTDDGVAVIGIYGPMVNSDSWILKYRGMVGYPHIAERLVQAYTDGAKATVLHLRTPGGTVAGLDVAADYINQLSRVMPVTAHADVAHSGGYWLANLTQNITMSPTGSVGSVGVIAVHLNYSEAYKRQGIEPTVLRAGTEKALGHPLDPSFDDKAKEDFMRSMSFVHEHFQSVVASGRGMLLQDLKGSPLGQGRVYHGMEALENNAIDKIGTLDVALAYAVRLSENKKQHFVMTNTEASDVDPNKRIDGKQPEAEVKTQAEGAAVSTGAVDATVQLAERVGELKAEVATLTARVTTLTAERESAIAVQKDLGTLVAASVATMQVALGASAADLSALSPTDLLARHAEVSQQFTARFPAGQVSAVTAETEEAKATSAGMTPQELLAHQARLRATI